MKTKNIVRLTFVLCLLINSLYGQVAPKHFTSKAETLLELSTHDWKKVKIKHPENVDYPFLSRRYSVLDSVCNLKNAILLQNQSLFTDSEILRYRAEYMKEKIDPILYDIGFLAIQPWYGKDRHLAYKRIYAEKLMNLPIEEKLILSSDELAKSAVTKAYLDVGYGLKDTLFISRFSSIPFGKIYQRIDKLYRGEAREKVIFFAFSKIEEFNHEITSYVQKAKDSFTTEKWLNALDSIAVGKMEGSAVPNFSFTDQAGHKIDLASLKGKVVVGELWFDGCGQCAILNKAMRPIFEEFGKNPNVVFLSINTDAESNWWTTGMKKGIYNHGATFDLTTGGNDHSFLKYFGFVGAPQTFYLDKDGNVIAVNPPRPGEHQDEKTRTDRLAYLRSLINKGLSK